MRPALGGGRVVVILAGVLPLLVLLALGREPAPWGLAVLAALATTAGLVVLEGGLRAIGFEAVSLPATLVVLYGTGLVWYATVEPTTAGVGFLAAAVLVRAWWPRPPRAPVLEGLVLGLVLGAGTLALEWLGGAGTTLAGGMPAVLDTLFSSRHGLLFWTPVLTIALVGLVARALRGRADAVGGLAAVAVIVLLDSALRPWSSGGIGNARFLPALPLFAPGLATALEAVRAAARRRPLALAAAAALVLVLWNLALMTQYEREMVPRDDTVAFPTLVENGARLVSAAVGSPNAWPANWAFARREHEPSARYDLLGGQDVLAGGPATLALGDPAASAALLGEGWSVRHPCGAATCREIEGGRARILLPVVDPRAVDLRVVARGQGRLRLTLNGAPLAEADLGDALAPFGASVPRSRLRRGLNALVFDVPPGGQATVQAVMLVPDGAAR